MRYLGLFFVLLAALVARAQDGAAVYKSHCASCHDAPTERVPSADALRAMSLPQVLGALQNGPMKTIGDSLTAGQRSSVALYLATPAAAASPAAAAVPPAAFCSIGAAATQKSPASPRWIGWSTDLANSRFQPAAAAGLSAADVPKLKLKWAFGLGNETNARSQPAVADGHIYFGTQDGNIYSLDARGGCIRWSSKIDGGVRSAVTIGPSGRGRQTAIYFGSGRNVYALDADSGKVLWKTQVEDYFAATITATPLLHQGTLYVGVSSFEEALPPLPNYECCSFRGSVSALNAATGKRIWKTYTIDQPAQPTDKNKSGVQMHGPSGAAVWSTPTFDEKLNVLYLATGDNYSAPATGTSDAVMAVDAKTGSVLWARQMTAGDMYNNACGVPGSANCPQSPGHDYDFGQPPILVSLSDGRQELVIVQKSAIAYGLDAANKGAILWQKPLGKGGALGGSEWGSASDGRNMYVALSDLVIKGAVPDKSSMQGYRLLLDPNQGGGLFALRLDNGELVWNAKPIAACGDRQGCSPSQSQAVSVIPGVVFSGSLDGHLRAYSTLTGEVLWDVDTARDYTTLNGQPAHGGSLDGPGPVIAGGMVYVNSGYGQFGGMPGNVLLAFSVDGN
jgi:polyvinyl alcohol dehydrogenase (cytochrome)